MFFGALGAAYCLGWLVHGLTRGRVPDNLMRMIDRDSEKFRPMLVANAVGFGIAVAVIAVAAFDA